MTKREQRLRDTLAALMEINPSELSLTTTFAEQGVDSLIGLRFAGQMQELFRTEIELEWLFDYPTIRELSGFLDERCGILDTDPV